MKKLLLFAGTADGREFLKCLDAQIFKVTVCVATEYGKSLVLKENTDAIVLDGRLTTDEIARLMQSEQFDFVVDATHPYAVEVTKNIKAAAEKLKLNYLRLLRNESENDGCIVVNNVQGSVQWLKNTQGNILLTTGSKELNFFTELEDFSARCFPRVLSCVDSVERCLSLGFEQGHIIAMQGPFSCQLNEAIINQFNIKHIVTKDGGVVGGFFEKIRAAKKHGVSVILIQRPEEIGYSIDEILEIVNNG